MFGSRATTRRGLQRSRYCALNHSLNAETIIAFNPGLKGTFVITAAGELAYQACARGRASQEPKQAQPDFGRRTAPPVHCASHSSAASRGGQRKIADPIRLGACYLPQLADTCFTLTLPGDHPPMKVARGLVDRRGPSCFESTVQLLGSCRAPRCIARHPDRRDALGDTPQLGAGHAMPTGQFFD